MKKKEQVYKKKTVLAIKSIWNKTFKRDSENRVKEISKKTYKRTKRK